MAPVCPQTACCMLCGREGWEKGAPQPGSDQEACSSLMECSQCWEIVHPACLAERNPHLEEPSSPHCCFGHKLSTPESPPMSDSMVEREARRILLCLEALVTTPLVDTKPISLVDFTLDSSDFDSSPESKSVPQRHKRSAPRRRLFSSPGNDAPEMINDVLKLVDEELEGFLLPTSSTLPSSSTPAANEQEFTSDAEKLKAYHVVVTSTPCPSPCLGDTAADDPNKSRSRQFLVEVPPSGSRDAASSDVVVSHEQEALCRVQESDIQLQCESTTTKSPTVNNEALVQAEDGAVGGNDIGHASPEDCDQYGLPPPSIPALNQTFVAHRDSSPTGQKDSQSRSFSAKTVARSEVPKEGRKNPSAVPKPPTARPTPTLPEPRKGLPEGPTTT
ncbi:hypothetical protein MRX96_016855 [Rhipicephalus microplus]